MRFQHESRSPDGDGHVGAGHAEPVVGASLPDAPKPQAGLSESDNSPETRPETAVGRRPASDGRLDTQDDSAEHLQAGSEPADSHTTPLGAPQETCRFRLPQRTARCAELFPDEQMHWCGACLMEVHEPERFAREVAAVLPPSPQEKETPDFQMQAHHMHVWAQQIRDAEDQQTLCDIADDIDLNADALSASGKLAAVLPPSPQEQETIANALEASALWKKHYPYANDSGLP